MEFIDELRWRGMLHDMTPGAEVELAAGMSTGYIGFDPTAPSLTIGNYVQIMLLSFWQKSGHRPIFLLGGATGSIGDPSGKDQERQLKSFEELNHNLEFQTLQARKFLNFESGKNKALLINNIDFYKDMNVLDFLRDVGKNLTINYMLGKEAVKKRLDIGLSFTEFSYQLLQAYDFLCLYKSHDCHFQMGGSDQWGNITSGTEFIRRNIPGAKAYAITSPLLTKSDGKKFGKSEEGNIWLDPELTSPYKFFQFWINADDADIGQFLRFFSFRSREEIETLEKDYTDDPRFLKKLLAEELTIRIHSKEDYRAVVNVSEILFNKHFSKESLYELDEQSVAAIAKEIPSRQLDPSYLKSGVNIVDLLADLTAISSSKGEARRAIKNNAIAVNKEKISSYEHLVDINDLVNHRFILIENGKKKKYILTV